MSQVDLSPAGSAMAEIEASGWRFLSRFPSLRCERAETSAERYAVYRLRCLTVLEQGWGTPDQFPDGIERDEHDDAAVHIGVWDGSVLAASNRLVFPAPGRILPTAAAFDLAPDTVSGLVDWSRTCIAAGYRGRRPEVLAAVVTRTWLELRARGFTHACGVLNPPMQRLYRRMGFSVARLGPPRRHWGEERHPVLVGPPTSVPGWLRQHLERPSTPEWEERLPPGGEPWSEEEFACPAASSTP
jgi:N-acyl-L-homoserine lactone synthetase